jgi:uncharacterized DUF497 family protein
VEELSFARHLGFDWDEENSEKIWRKHKVSPFECEQTFFNRPLIVLPDEPHSRDGSRFGVLGRTDADRRLALVFTPRKSLVRVITAQDMNLAEKEVYANHEE